MDNSSLQRGKDVPSLGYEGAVWPPPPVSQTQGLWYPFKTLLSRAEGTVPNFRTGSLNLAPDGISIQGKAVTRYEIQVPILIACLLLRLGFIIAYAVMEYAIRRDESLSVPWASVKRVVLVPTKKRVCVVYDAPNYKDVIKTFSLAFTLDQTLYDSFTATAEQYLPGRVSVGKLRVWTSPPSWVFLAGVILVIALLVVIGSFGGFSPSR